MKEDACTLHEADIILGEWGVYSFPAFDKKYRSMMEGSDLRAFEDYHIPQQRPVRNSEVTALGGFPDAPVNEIGTLGLIAFDATLRTVVPRRKEEPLTGDWVIESPVRGGRPGGKGRIPLDGPDVFKYIIEGARPSAEQKITGHAIVLAADREDVEGLELDDPFALEIKCRDMTGIAARAFAVDNRFQTFIRHIDPRIVKLITKLQPGFVNYKDADSSYPGFLATLPYGMNLVTFPKEFVPDLSDVSIYDLYAMFKATQKAIRRVSEAYRGRTLLTGDERDSNGLEVEDLVTDVFMNIRKLAGGTIPRFHMQAYIRARTLRDKCYEKRPAKLLREQHNQYLSEQTGGGKMRGERYLLHRNRNCNLFSVPIPSRGYETKIELKDQACRFENCSDERLWDIAEMLVFDSRILDKLLSGPKKEPEYAGKDRNVLFYDTGIVVRPFAFAGGVEEGYPGLIIPISSETFERAYQEIGGEKEQVLTKDMEKITEADCACMYRMPEDSRSREDYRRLCDVQSPLFKKAKINIHP